MENLVLLSALASIVSLLLVIFGFTYKANKARLDKLDDQRRRINQELEELSTISDAATTQGKRLDLYIYKESVLSHARFQYIRLEIISSVMHLASFMLFMFVTTTPSKFNSVLSLEKSLNLNVNSPLYQYKAEVLLFLFFCLLLLNIWQWRVNRKYRKRILRISNIFIDSLEGHVSASFSHDVKLRSKIY